MLTLFKSLIRSWLEYFYFNGFTSNFNSCTANDRNRRIQITSQWRLRKFPTLLPTLGPSQGQRHPGLENIQRKFTKRILSECRDLDYWDGLKKLKLLSQQRKSEHYKIIHTWKILQKRAPNSTCLEFYNNERLGVRAKFGNFYHKAHRSVSTAFDNLIGVIKAARPWNLLPKQVNSILT